MLKVTFCAYDAPNSVGGPKSWLERILPELQQLGIEVDCLFLNWGGDGPTIKSLRRKGLHCPAVLCEGSTESRIEWILGQLQVNPPDIFVPNLVVPAYFAAAWVRKAGVPTIGILHSDDEFYQAIGSEFAFGRAQFAVSSLVCVSRELEQQVKSKKPQNTAVMRIPYGVPIPEQKVMQYRNRFRIAYVGRLAEKQKQISKVARALCRVVAEIPGSEAVMFGEGPDRRNVEEILATEGQDLPIKLAGFFRTDQIQSQLLNCDVIVLLSDYEGLPIAILEAMACGVVPVCLRMRSGIPELVENGVTGLVVDDRDDGLVAAIRRLKRDKELWNSLSQAARTKVIQENSIQTNAAQWAKHLHSLQERSSVKRKVKIPRNFALPPVHPSLACEDPRQVANSFQRKIYQNGKKWVDTFEKKWLRNFK